MTVAPTATYSYRLGAANVRRTRICWIGTLAVACLVNIGVAGADAGQDTPRKASTTTRPAQKRLYSAQRSASRKATLARARAVATAREITDTVLPRYKVDASGDLVPDVRAAAAIIYNPETNEVLWEENSQDQRSIASITKVMTATVFLENNPDVSQPVTIARSDVFQASTTHLRPNDKVTVDDLLHLLLIASDNAAARALARVSPHGSDGFIDRMNEKAAELGLAEHALRRSVGPALRQRIVGLRHGAAHHAASSDERIGSIMRTPEYTVYTREPSDHVPQHEPPARARRCRSASGQDRLHLEGGLLPGDAAAAAANSGQQVAVVVLGARSNAGRFLETVHRFIARTLVGEEKGARAAPRRRPCAFPVFLPNESTCNESMDSREAVRGPVTCGGGDGVRPAVSL